VVAGWVGDLDFDQRHVRMHQVEAMVYGCKLVAVLGAEAKVLCNRTVVEGQARQIYHTHRVEVEELVKQTEQSFAIATEEQEKRIYRIPGLGVRAMLTVHKIAAGVERRTAIVGGILPVPASSPTAVVELAAGPGRRDASGKKAGVVVVDIADTAAAEVEAVR